MRIKIINGANLNMLGIREIDIYGQKTYDDLISLIQNYGQQNNILCQCFQSNHEGDIVDNIHETYFSSYDALIINPGAFTHYSYAIRDALAILTCPIIEVHLSDINEREEFRKKNVIHDVCDHTIMGKGFEGYIEAIDYLLTNNMILDEIFTHER